MKLPRNSDKNVFLGQKLLEQVSTWGQIQDQIFSFSYLRMTILRNIALPFSFYKGQIHHFISILHAQCHLE